MAFTPEETRTMVAARANNLGGYTEPGHKRSPESIEKQKRTCEARKNFNKLARYMMEADIQDEDEALAELRAHGFESGDYQTAILWGQMKKAIYNLDTEAAKYVRDTAGYKPTETLNLGNADDQPFETIDLSKLSTEELQRMVLARKPLKETEE